MRLAGSWELLLGVKGAAAGSEGSALQAADLAPAVERLMSLFVKF